ncbi:hypothetical protein RFI02_15740 [Acinetobacter sichuanensis]|uniref:hypothetical protein n=1 Tax=Acinetobacter sichuanensis TaxID=2136183 RepID=UPI002810239C|nr:hypothetical protein [Acinetobacter sichuanensis]MDQ9022562.1 hypothetical protein [Acinetobacter sichuanensis]
MKITMLFFIFIIFTLSSTIYAQENYQRCSDLETDHLLKALTQQSNLFKKPQSNLNPTFYDCLIIQQEQVLIATSQEIQQFSNNAGNYQLDLFLINRHKQSIIQHYHHPTPIIPQTRLENIKFDINPYSNIPNQHIIGLGLHQVHIGGVSSSTRILQLFHIQAKQAIKWVLQDLITDQVANSTPYQCEDAQSSELNRKLILLSSKTQGLPDIRLNENIENIHVDIQNCYVKIIKQKQSQILKFDGKKYYFKAKNLLQIDI